MLHLPTLWYFGTSVTYPHFYRRVKFVVIPPRFVYQQYLWNIAIQPAVGWYHSWANWRCSSCSPLGERTLWNGTMPIPVKRTIHVEIVLCIITDCRYISPCFIVRLVIEEVLQDELTEEVFQDELIEEVLQDELIEDVPQDELIEEVPQYELISTG